MIIHLIESIICLFKGVHDESIVYISMSVIFGFIGLVLYLIMLNDQLRAERDEYRYWYIKMVQKDKLINPNQVPLLFSEENPIIDTKGINLN